jgi:hypothetical protein
MAERKDSVDIAGADADNVAACVRALNHTIGELAQQHGVSAVVVALTQVMGCSSCATDRRERAARIRVLIERISLA